METYLVGGAVRDEQLGLPVHERDWVVVGATVNDMLEMGYSQVGRDFPVFLHPETHEEYALARTERKTGEGHTGFECFTDITVSLEDDLLRRDLTINAIAKSSSGEFTDPFNGMADLQARKLRHVSDAFREDPLRVLRIARFAARFKTLGFSIADETLDLMTSMSNSGELENLTPERVWKETEKALRTDSPSEYFQVLRHCGALHVLFPEIDALFGVPQSEIHHPEIDTGIHTMMVLDQAALLSSETSVRLAALLHDLGKAKTPQQEWPKHIRHEHTGIPLVKKLCKRIKIPRDLTDIAMLVCEHHLNSHRAYELRPATIQKLLKATDAYRRPARFESILLACEADARGRKGFELREYPQRQYLLDCFYAAQKVSTETLGIENMSGPAIGEAINDARIESIEKIKRQSGININSHG